MRGRVAILLFALSICSSIAQFDNVERRESPGLKEFTGLHPKAAQILRNKLAEAFSNRTVKLYYFYPATNSEPTAFHYYPNTTGLEDVFICVSESQKPIDQYISLLFEVINSKRATKLLKLWEDGCAGAISAETYATEVTRLEFESLKETRNLLSTLDIESPALAGSRERQKYGHLPEGFDDYLASVKKDSPDTLRRYENQIDKMKAEMPRRRPEKDNESPPQTQK